MYVLCNEAPASRKIFGRDRISSYAIYDLIFRRFKKASRDGHEVDYVTAKNRGLAPILERKGIPRTSRAFHSIKFDIAVLRYLLMV